LTPKWSGTAWTTYKLNEQWRVGAGLNFTAKQNPTRAAFAVPAHLTVDVMAEYRPTDAWTIKGNISNLGNKYYASELYPGHYVPGAARNVQVTASYAF
jgi:catecholate siderophore receptor